MMRISSNAGSARTWCTKAIPFMTGMFQSTRTRSTAPDVWSFSSASWPSPASTTSMPSETSSRLSSMRIARESSMTRARMFLSPPSSVGHRGAKPRLVCGGLGHRAGVGVAVAVGLHHEAHDASVAGRPPARRDRGRQLRRGSAGGRVWAAWATPVMFCAISLAPLAASATLRLISLVVAVCSSTALAIVFWMSLIWSMIVADLRRWPRPRRWCRPGSPRSCG